MSARAPAPRAGDVGRYGGVAIALHWSVAALIACAFPLGLYIADLPASPRRSALLVYHQWLGATVFTLACVRLAWRLAHRPPELPAFVPAWQRRAARGVHRALYALALAVPLSGLAHSAAAGLLPLGVGWTPLPGLAAPDERLAVVLKLVHQLLNFALLALVVAHVGAALKHHFVDRDRLLARMLPEWRYFFGSSGSGGSARR